MSTWNWGMNLHISNQFLSSYILQKQLFCQNSMEVPLFKTATGSSVASAWCHCILTTCRSCACWLQPGASVAAICTNRCKNWSLWNCRAKVVKLSLVSLPRFYHVLSSCFIKYFVMSGRSLSFRILDSQSSTFCQLSSI